MQTKNDAQQTGGLADRWVDGWADGPTVMDQLVNEQIDVQWPLNQKSVFMHCNDKHQGSFSHIALLK